MNTDRGGSASKLPARSTRTLAGMRWCGTPVPNNSLSVALVQRVYRGRQGRLGAHLVLCAKRDAAATRIQALHRACSAKCS